MAIYRARCRYAKRRVNGHEIHTSLVDTHGKIRTHAVLKDAGAIRPTDLRDHDRPVAHRDRKHDIALAIDQVVSHMVNNHEVPPEQRHRAYYMPIEYITRTIIEGYMYHYRDRYSRTGDFLRFCSTRGVGRKRIYKWRPVILGYLREALSAYAPS